jgi:hypothetical protein
MRPSPLKLFSWKPLALVALLTGCFTNGDEDALRLVSLAQVDLVGHYYLASYLFEYGDGQVLNPTVLKLEGKLFLEPDSNYLERIWVENIPTDTKGKITHVRSLNNSRRKGEMTLTLTAGDSAQTGTSMFSFLGDTLVLVTSVAKERDPRNKGFKETVSWLLDTLP